MSGARPAATPAHASIERRELMELSFEVEQFLYQEAELLDERRFDEWYELLAEDLSYTMPVQVSVYPGDVNNRAPESAGYGGDYFFEHKHGMGLRVRKALSGRDHIERPASKLRHMVTNVRILDRDDAGVAVRSSFLVHRFRHGEFQDLYVGRRDDSLRRADNAYGFEIASRVVTLDQTVLLGGGIGFFF